MKINLLITALLFSTVLTAQDDETLFSDVRRVGAFGGPFFEYTSLNDDVETTSGGGGALVLDDFFLGGYGMGEASFIRINQSEDLRERVKFKHGGFWLGYVPLQHKVIHPFTSLKLGWGKARYKETDLDEDNTFNEVKDGIFVLNPEAGIEINVFSFFRISATASYRLVNGINSVPNFNDDDFSSFGGTLTLRFGGFGSEWD